MNLFRLLRRNLRFHRRANFAVLLGVAVGTAVLTGALLVGDSLRGSLREQVFERLDGVEKAMVLPRFISSQAVGGLGNNLGWIEPVNLLRATVEVGSEENPRRVANVLISTHAYRVEFVDKVGVGSFLLSGGLIFPRDRS